MIKKTMQKVHRVSVMFQCAKKLSYSFVGKSHAKYIVEVEFNCSVSMQIISLFHIISYTNYIMHCTLITCLTMKTIIKTLKI